MSYFDTQLFALKRNQNSPFDEQLSSQRTPIIEINGSYGLSALRDIQLTEGSATISSIDAEFKLEHTTAGDKALLATARRGRYLPGYAAESGIGVRLSDLPTGDAVARWGYFDFEAGTQNVNDGAFFGVDSDGIFIAIYNNGEEKIKVYKDDWNIDRDESIDLQKGNIFQIRFTYYGYGLVEFRLLSGETGDRQQKIKTLHTYTPDGNATFTNSNLQVAAQVESTSTANAFNLFVSGRQFAVLGIPKFVKRSVSHLRENVTVGTANYVPIMTFRRKVDNRSVPINAQGFEVITDNNLAIQWRVDADLDATSYITPSNHDANETAIEVDETATTVDVATGIKIGEDLVEGAGFFGTSSGAEGELSSDIPDEYTVTLCAKALSAEATATFIGKMVEER